MKTVPDDDVDIDVCMGCGRYYGMTQSLIDRWCMLYRPTARDVMPQLCWKCLGEDGLSHE
jgi:hypothetical protein